jgi:hypothetical protein
VGRHQRAELLFTPAELSKLLDSLTDALQEAQARTARKQCAAK